MAEPTCPWLATGTAAAVLGGPPQLQLKMMSATEGSCTFEFAQGTLTSALEIVVSSQKLPACAPGSEEVAGVGNEATTCQAKGPGGELRTTIESRVRSLHFRTTLTVHSKAPAPNAAQEQKDSIERIAEAVAGSLF
jgi:hypothetical protein